MTKEEAIAWLEHHFDPLPDGTKQSEAVSLAIKALEQEPCKDAISRQAVTEIINDIRDCISVEGYWAILERMKKLSSVKPQESKTGHWISHYDEDAKEGWYECNRCHTERAFNTDYCPDCGAKMVKIESEE